MLRRILWLLMGLILSHTGIANDPFDKARRQAIPQTSAEKQAKRVTPHIQRFFRKPHLHKFKSSACYNIKPIGSSCYFPRIKSASPKRGMLSRQNTFKLKKSANNTSIFYVGTMIPIAKRPPHFSLSFKESL